MKKFLFILYPLFLARTLSFGGSLLQIQQDAEAGRISRQEALVYEAFCIHEPASLPAAYRSGEEPVKCGFSVRADLENGWALLSAEQQARLRPLLARPSPPFSAVSPRGLFRMHYFLEGSDAVSTEDANTDGIPDFIEEAGLALERAYAVIVEQLGFHEPLQDDVDGPEWDVFFENYPGYGETALETLVSVSPTTYRSYIVMDNDFRNTYTKGLDALRVTCAHEFFHMVQLAYQYRSSDVYLMEASAVYMEDVVCDSVNDYIQYLHAIFGTDNVPFTRRDTNHEYGMALWFHFLTTRYGPDMVRMVWEEIIQLPSLDACQQALIPFGAQLADEITQFYGWNLATGARVDTIRFYPEGHLYPEQVIQEIVDLNEPAVFRRSVQKTGCRYFGTMDHEPALYWVMVNTDWNSPGSIGEALLQIRKGQAEPYYDEVADSIFSALISDGSGWQYAVFTQSMNSGGELTAYREFNENLFGSISGSVMEFVPADTGWSPVSGLPDIIIRCQSAGEDSLFDTADDQFYSPQLTNTNGLFQFFGLTPGWYRLVLDPGSVPEDQVPIEPDTLRIYRVHENEDVEAVFRFRRLLETDLPSAIPNPYIPGVWPEMKIPFSLKAPDVVTLTIYTSQGYRIFQDSDYFSADVHAFLWDGTVDGKVIPTGIYLYTITGKGRLIRREKIAIIR
jgi:hypothetical protein